MDDPPRGALLRAADVRRPPWPDDVGPRRRPSGQDRVFRRHGSRQVWTCAAVFATSLIALVLLRLTSQRAGTVQAVDAAVEGFLRGGSGRVALAENLESLARTLGYRVLWIPAIVVLAWFGRWRHLLVYLSTVSVIAAATQAVGRENSFARAVWRGVTGHADPLIVPAWPVIVLAAVATAGLAALLPRGPLRRWGWVLLIGGLVIMAAARVALGLDSASATVASAALGCSAAMLAFQLLAPETEFPVVYHHQVRAHLRLDAARKARIIDAVRAQLGVPLTDLQPYRLDGSAGSTPCCLLVDTQPPTTLFGKLYATTHLRSDRWYKLARVLRYGRLEDEAPFSSVRRLVEHEDYMLRLLRDGGVRVPEPGGVVEVVAGREYLLVTELVPGAVEILESGVPDEVIDDALLQIRRLWQAGAAHRDVKPSNVLVQGHRVVLIDVSFGELRPSRWRQAVDLANMMLTLALVAGPERVLQRSGRFFAPDEVAEAFAATSSLTVPRQLRRLLDARRRDLVAEFRGLLPSRPRISVQRWSLRRALLAVATMAGALFAVVLVALNLRAGGLL